MPLNVSAAPANRGNKREQSGGGSVGFTQLQAGRTKVVDQDSSNHGSTATAQAQVEALQDALCRRPQRRRDSCAQVGDTGGPNRRVCHTWETQTGEGLNAAAS